jgi:NtrC-family two-component system response regulator AlgB
MNLLIIDDEASLRRTLRTALESMGHRVMEASDGGRALEAVRSQRFEVAFLDLWLGREQGLDLLPELLRAAPDLHVVIITAHASLESAIDAMRRGAFDYLPKPFTPNQLRVVLDRSALLRGLQESSSRATNRSSKRHSTLPARWHRRTRPYSFAARVAPGKACSPASSTREASEPRGRS